MEANSKTNISDPLTEKEFHVGSIKPGSGAIRYKAIKEHLCSDLDGGAVILNLANGTYFGLNSVGSFIWNALKEERSFEELIQLVGEEFDVEEETCRSEVQRFLDEVLKQGLILPVDE
ncbi:MAG: PqqD family protein [Acidobacteriota bacterium]|nr:MAG: PqqD family protein [Acidobacteriota bacterium]